MQSDLREDIVIDIIHAVFRCKGTGIAVASIWIPAHTGVDRNELADKYVKGVTKHRVIEMTVSYDKAEVKSIIKSEMKRKWQEEWHKESKGQYMILVSLYQ